MVQVAASTHAQDQLRRRLAMALGAAARQVRKLPVDQIPVPFGCGVEAGHSRVGDHPIYLTGGQDAPLVRRQGLDDVGPQASHFLVQLKTSSTASVLFR